MTSSVNRHSLKELMQLVDQKVEILLTQRVDQQQQISLLLDENQQLKKHYAVTLARIEQYIAELEQIKQTLCQS